jgi:uncharacterized protein (TIGR03118 family)
MNPSPHIPVSVPDRPRPDGRPRRKERSMQRRRLGWIGATAAAVILVGYPLPAVADASHHGRGPTFTQTNLVADQPGAAAITDPNLVNAWGMSRGPNTPIWVSDNGTDVSTLYRTDMGQPASIVPLVVATPGGAPTGQVFNDTSEFNLPGTTTPAHFIFAGENGDITAWNAGTSAVLVAHTDGAVYKGLALAHTPFGPLLLAANFHDNRIDVFDGSFEPVDAGSLFFRDPFLPRGYAPFNVAEIGSRVFVTYAKQDADAHDDVAGPGNGFIDEFTDFGLFLHRFASRGDLNSPWGMTIAPSAFGRFAGDLLVGNFGDGRIHVFNPRSGHELATLRDANHRPIVIDGLWGLLVGDAVAGGPDAVWFSAGPADESHGLLGTLTRS